MAKTRLLYIFALLALALGALALGAQTALLALYALALLPVVSAISLLVYPLVTGVYFTLHRRNVFRGDSQPATLRLRNGCIFAYPRIELSLRDELADYGGDGSAVGTLAPVGVVERKYELMFPFRGVYEVGLKSALVTDFLGLFRLRFRCRQKVSVTVYPKLVPGFTMPISSRQMTEGSHGIDRFSDDWADVSDVRRHDPSDDYRKIHWKLSAKRGEFIVKNYRTPGLNKTLIFIETAPTGLSGRDAHEYEDTIVSLAASAADYCLANRQACRLVYGEGEDDGLDLESPKDMEKALALLALVKFEGGREGLLRAVYSALISRRPFEDIAVFMSHVEVETCAMLKTAFSSGHNVFLYYVCPAVGTPSAEDYSILDELRTHGVTVEILK